MTVKPNLPNNKPCPLSRRELARLNWDERFTVDMFCQKFEVSQSTVYRYFTKYNLNRGERKVDWTKIQDAVMNDDGTVRWIVDEVDVNADAVPSGTERSEVAILPTAATQQWLKPTDDKSNVSTLDDNDPFTKLTFTQRKAIPLLAGLMKHEIDITNDEVCEKLGISEPTLITWRKDPTFRDALIQFRKAEFKAEGTMVWTETMMNRLHQNKDTADDRKLMADVLGLTNKDQTVNVNIGYRPPDGRFKDF